MLKELRGYRLLVGYRGERHRDIGGLVQVLLRVSQMALELQEEVAELDINRF